MDVFYVILDFQSLNEPSNNRDPSKTFFWNFFPTIAMRCLYFRHKLINKFQEMQCVAHYSNSNRTYSKLKTLSENQLNRLFEAKSVREKKTLEANRHSIQCATNPTKDDFDCSVHGILLDPCYKSFNKILCPSKISKLQDTLPQDVQRTKRQKRSSSTADLFPTTCFKGNVSVEEREKVKLKFPIKLHYKVQL